MKRKIKIFLNHLHIWYRYYIRRQRTTIKGLYLAYYIADKYLLGKQIDIIQEYETMIDSTEARMKKISLLTTCGRADAAFFALVHLVIFSTPEMKDKIYSYLKDWRYLSSLKKYVKAGIIL